MSGHSKWSKVKHQKATTDVVKARAFTQATRGILVAVSEGGGISDPEGNFRLRLAIEKARAVNMPKENIDRAIAKASGGGVGTLERIMYEGYGPGGVAMLVEVATDNRNRTASHVRNIFEHLGGSFAGIGAVSFLFESKGVITVVTEGLSYDAVLEIALSAGVLDVIEQSDVFELFTSPDTLHAAKESIELAGLPIDNADLVMHPISTILVGSLNYDKLKALIDELENTEDVLCVYTNVANE